MTETAVYAAGGVLWRIVEEKILVLLIHRTRYRDVTLPKGKVDPGEMLAETAAREVFEETGIRVSLGVPVGVSRYHMPNKRQKIVHYWAAEATDAAIRASAFVPNKEIAALEWVPLKKATSRLSYPVDVEIIETFTRLVDEGVLRTFPDHRPPPRQGGRARGLERQGLRAAAVPARQEAGQRDRRVPCWPSGSARSSPARPRAASRPWPRSHRRSDGRSTDRRSSARTPGRKGSPMPARSSAIG